MSLLFFCGMQSSCGVFVVGNIMLWSWIWVRFEGMILFWPPSRNSKGEIGGVSREWKMVIGCIRVASYAKVPPCWWTRTAIASRFEYYTSGV